MGREAPDYARFGGAGRTLSASAVTRRHGALREPPRRCDDPCSGTIRHPSARSRNAFPITDTDDRLIASAATIGLSSQPVKG